MTDDLAELLTLTREVDSSGTVRYRDSAGRLHRLHGPAVIWQCGEKMWAIRVTMYSSEHTWVDKKHLTRGVAYDR